MHSPAGVTAENVSVPECKTQFSDLIDRVESWARNTFPCLKNSNQLRPQFVELCKISRADDEMIILMVSLTLRYLNVVGGELLREHPRDSEIFYLLVLMMHLSQKVLSDSPIFSGSLCKFLHLGCDRLMSNELRVLSTLGWDVHTNENDLQQLAAVLGYPPNFLRQLAL
eukprot:GAFH01003122.1.p1 GENE.GAFH01003122.1~~GAFH01003122.1.p1  ORF type:complete len:181 (+),score=11.90 GAFH01003122.1:38-544(+)